MGCDAADAAITAFHSSLTCREVCELHTWVAVLHDGQGVCVGQAPPHLEGLRVPLEPRDKGAVRDEFDPRPHVIVVRYRPEHKPRTQRPSRLQLPQRPIPRPPRQNLNNERVGDNGVNNGVGHEQWGCTGMNNGDEQEVA